jgi:hypothetical protein
LRKMGIDLCDGSLENTSGHQHQYHPVYS